MFDDENDDAEQEATASHPARPEPLKSAPEPKRMTPAQWAEKLGHINHADPRIPQSVTHADWQHAAADALYGWSQHAYHFQSQPFLLSQADYENALGAAAKYPLCAPYEKALPPGQEKRFEGFRPRAAKG